MNIVQLNLNKEQLEEKQDLWFYEITESNMSKNDFANAIKAGRQLRQPASFLIECYDIDARISFNSLFSCRNIIQVHQVNFNASCSKCKKVIQSIFEL